MRLLVGTNDTVCSVDFRRSGVLITNEIEQKVSTITQPNFIIHVFVAY